MKAARSSKQPSKAGRGPTFLALSGSIFETRDSQLAVTAGRERVPCTIRCNCLQDAGQSMADGDEGARHGRACRRHSYGGCCSTSAVTSRTPFLPNADEQFLVPLHSARERVEAAGCPIPAVETTVRYDWARSVLQGVVSEPKEFLTTTTDRIDRVVTHKVLGLIIFAVLMVVVFQSVFVWAKPLMDGIGAGFDWLGDWVGSKIPEGALHSLVVDGVIHGVGGVLQFALPQILILFTFIALLEDCGYVARAAFLIGPRSWFCAGLSGRSFIPMLSSFACTAHTWHHGRAGNRERARPLDDDPRRAALDLLGPAAGLRPVDRRLRAGDHLFRRMDRGARADARGSFRAGSIVASVGVALVLSQQLLPRQHRAVRHGNAELQMAFALELC